MALLDDLVPLLITPFRSIGSIIPDLVLEEDHRDQTMITEHPVEKGASISDHAYQRPCEITVRCAASNSSAGSEGYVQQVYQQFIELQRAREPFEVSTGKRLYKNMLISSLTTRTNESMENAIELVVGMREVIIAKTQATSGGSANQANPASTASTSDTGTKQAVDTTGTRVSSGGPGGIGGI